MQNYPEKELRIFEGVLALAEGGENLHIITVQDIARAAGIGKGTVYEYFSCKEEILAGTILYCIENELDSAEQAMQRETTFDGCLEGLGRLLEDVLDHRLVRYRLMMAAVQRSDTPRPTEKYCEKVQVQIGRIVQVARRLIALGRADGQIRPEYTDEYCLFVLQSVLPGLILRCDSPLLRPSPARAGDGSAVRQTHQALVCAGQMLRRALG